MRSFGKTERRDTKPVVSGAIEGREVLGIGIITECLQEVGNRSEDMERFNKINRGVAIDVEVALRRI